MFKVLEEMKMEENWKHATPTSTYTHTTTHMKFYFMNNFFICFCDYDQEAPLVKGLPPSWVYRSRTPPSAILLCRSLNVRGWPLVWPGNDDVSVLICYEVSFATLPMTLQNYPNTFSSKVDKKETNNKCNSFIIRLKFRYLIILSFLIKL